MKIKKIGLDLNTVRDYLTTEDDIKKSLEIVKKLGYDQILPAPCYVPYDVFGKIAKNAGLEIIAVNDGIDNLYGCKDKLMKFCKMIGTRNVAYCEGYGLSTELYDEMTARLMNTVGYFSEKSFGNVIYTVMPNDYKSSNGKPNIDYIIDKINNGCFKLCLDTFLARKANADICFWMEKLKEKTVSLTLTDATSDGKMTELGKGIIDFDDIIKKANEIGIRSFVVSQTDNFTEDNPFKSIEISSVFLHERYM